MPSENNPLEIWIENTVVRWAKMRGWYTRKCIWGGMTSAPDRLFAKGGVVIFIEFKRLKKKATESQAREHEKMRATGLKVFVCDTVDKAKEILLRHDPASNRRACLEDII